MVCPLLNFLAARQIQIDTKNSQTGLTQIFGGFVAYGVSFDDGRLIAPYKVIFILLGSLAIIVGIAILIWMPDSPVLAGFLTTEERIAALERVRDGQGGTENKRLKKDQVKEALTDVRTWLIVLTSIMSKLFDAIGRRTDVATVSKHTEWCFE
jgi:MFS transporter, ACS family, allantoate permease